jgi:S1-C subfamily serine protease
VVGTGFFVHSEGLVLTAKHVTEGASRAMAMHPQAKLLVGLAMPNISGPISIRQNFELVQCDVVEEDARHDLALLRLATNPFNSGRPSGVHRTPDGGMGVNSLFGLAPLTLSRPRDGEDIAVSGYPLSNPTLITTSGIIASSWATDTMDVVPEGAPEGFTMPDIKDSYLADVAVNPGNSGGPVYLRDVGHVIGVCVAFRIAEADAGGVPLMYNSGLSIVVPINYGVELLGRHVDLAA